MIENVLKFEEEMASRGYKVEVKKDGGVVARRLNSARIVKGASGCKFSLDKYMVDKEWIIERTSCKVVDALA